MAAKRIQIDKFITLAKTTLVIDVRSPKEYQQAHYPSAISLPLFSDEERKIVGTTYKQQSREKAIKIGLDFYGPKMKDMLNEVESLLNARQERSVIVHCWRGGMRSAAVAWLLDLYGFKVYTLEGGYKAFRNWVLNQFKIPYSLRVLGGFTGSGKTEILKELAQNHHPMIDLEGLAEHKGSAFGNLANHQQKSTEFFENKLALKLFELSTQQFDDPTIWVESESSRVGNINIPHLFFNQMKTATRLNIEVPFEERLQFILKGYGHFDKTALIAATKRIKKRLGGLRMQETIAFIEQDDLHSAFSILLNYYDTAYLKSQRSFQKASYNIPLPGTDEKINAELILKALQQPA